MRQERGRLLLGEPKKWNDIKAHSVYEIKRNRKIEKGGKVGITALNTSH